MLRNLPLRQGGGELPERASAILLAGRDARQAIPPIGNQALHPQIDGFVSQLPFNTTRVEWHPWEIGLRFAPGLPPGWIGETALCKAFWGGAPHAAPISPL